MVRYRRYRCDRPKREFSLCRAALRAILCEQLGCGNRQLSFETSEHGKPFALVEGASVPINFNVSHSGRHGLIARSSQVKVGVDVEERQIRFNLDGALETIFAPRERAELIRARGERKDRLFFGLWTMKEALVKAVGVGLALDFSQFEIPAKLYRGHSVSDVFKFPRLDENMRGSHIRWKLLNLGNADFAAALAFESEEEQRLVENPMPLTFKGVARK